MKPGDTTLEGRVHPRSQRRTRTLPLHLLYGHTFRSPRPHPLQCLVLRGPSELRTLGPTEPLEALGPTPRRQSRRRGTTGVGPGAIRTLRRVRGVLGAREGVGLPTSPRRATRVLMGTALGTFLTNKNQDEIYQGKGAKRDSNFLMVDISKVPIIPSVTNLINNTVLDIEHTILLTIINDFTRVIFYTPTHA